EQHVAAPGLGRRDLLAGGVLVAGVLRDRDPGPGEGVLHQPRAVEADVLVVAVLVAHAAVAHTQGRPVGVAAAPGVAHAELGHRPVDDGLDLLRIRGVGDLPADVAGDLAGLLLRGDLAGRVLGSGVLRSPAGGVLGGALGGLLGGLARGLLSLPLAIPGLEDLALGLQSLDVVARLGQLGLGVGLVALDLLALTLLLLGLGLGVGDGLLSHHLLDRSV